MCVTRITGHQQPTENWQRRLGMMRRLTTIYLSFLALTSVNSVSQPAITIKADRGSEKGDVGSR